MLPDDIDKRIMLLDLLANRLRKMTAGSITNEVLVPLGHLKEYLDLLDRLRFLERHLSNLVITANAHGVTYPKEKL